MALFNFRKKKEEQKTLVCACNGWCPANEAESMTHSCCGETVDSICYIKVLGSGCASCHQLYENARTAINNMGLSVAVEYITDMAKVMEYGVMRMPALVVNENVVAMEKVLKSNEIEQLLHKLRMDF